MPHIDYRFDGDAFYDYRLVVLSSVISIYGECAILFLLL